MEAGTFEDEWTLFRMDWSNPSCHLSLDLDLLVQLCFQLYETVQRLRQLMENQLFRDIARKDVQVSIALCFDIPVALLSICFLGRFFLQ